MPSSTDHAEYASGWPERGRGWPGEQMPQRARLWLPVVISFLVQVPPTAFQLWRSRWEGGRFGDNPFVPIDNGSFDGGLFDDAGHGAGAVGLGFAGAGLLVLALAVVGPLALIAARRFPGPVAGLCALAAAAPILIDPTVVTPFAALAFAIVLGIVRGARIWVYAAVAVAWVVTIVLAGLWGITFNPFRVAGTTLVLVVFMGMGEAIRRRRDRIVEVRRTTDARRTTAEQRERVRIARELHDVLAHSLSQINVQAGVGLHLIDSQPEKAAEALANIKSASKNALDEVRTVLGILRSDPAEGGSAPLTPEPDLAGLPALIESFQAQGLDVTYVNALEAPNAATAATQLALYRICQEALTNVLRHAEARGASVYLGVDRGSYLLTVTDDGTAQAHDRSIEPGGGLLGMRERAELLGGTLRTVRAVNGGFRVEARIPVPVVRASQGDRGNG
ncbi:sensor histidine kinase [Glaciibacter sp. 2TAF33]|uniref:sensor histidine kinase n=1 Tax=Glaciibacter sp. 2TAF33 TaxID=3233015 RepID=UPI003F9256A0